MTAVESLIPFLSLFMHLSPASRAALAWGVPTADRLVIRVVDGEPLGALVEREPQPGIETFPSE